MHATVVDCLNLNCWAFRFTHFKNNVRNGMQCSYNYYIGDVSIRYVRDGNNELMMDKIYENRGTIAELWNEKPHGLEIFNAELTSHLYRHIMGVPCHLDSDPKIIIDRYFKYLPGILHQNQ